MLAIARVLWLFDVRKPELDIAAGASEGVGLAEGADGRGRSAGTRGGGGFFNSGILQNQKIKSHTLDKYLCNPSLTSKTCIPR